jgi:hypothetical protein
MEHFPNGRGRRYIRRGQEVSFEILETVQIGYPPSLSKCWIWWKVGQSQQQNQCTGFSTGEWSRPPELFRTAENLVLRLESKSGVKFIGVQGNEIESMRREPDLKNAERLTLTESNENSSRMKSMEPMKPMH